MAQTLDITWYGQSMFAVACKDVTVVIDPTPPETGYSYDPVSADVVLMSHQHFDHAYLDGIAGNPKVINASGTFELGKLKVRGFDSFHDAARGKERGPNVIYTWEQEGFRIGHFGDLGDEPTHDVVKKLLKLDIAMVPVGGVFTIDAEQAVRLIRDLEPAIVLPMHYGTADGTVQLQPVDEFTRRFKGPVRQVASRPVEITRESIPTTGEVWVLPYR